MEVWALGRSGDATTVTNFADGADAACFTDGWDTWTVYDAEKDDVVVVDREGLIRHRFNSLDDSLWEESQRNKLDRWVRELL